MPRRAPSPVHGRTSRKCPSRCRKYCTTRKRSAPPRFDLSALDFGSSPARSFQDSHFVSRTCPSAPNEPSPIPASLARIDHVRARAEAGGPDRCCASIATVRTGSIRKAAKFNLRNFNHALRTSYSRFEAQCTRVSIRRMSISPALHEQRRSSDRRPHGDLFESSARAASTRSRRRTSGRRAGAGGGRRRGGGGGGRVRSTLRRVVADRTGEIRPSTVGAGAHARALDRVPERRRAAHGDVRATPGRRDAKSVRRVEEGGDVLAWDGVVGCRLDDRTAVARRPGDRVSPADQIALHHQCNRLTKQSRGSYSCKVVLPRSPSCRCRIVKTRRPWGPCTALPSMFPSDRTEQAP